MQDTRDLDTERFGERIGYTGLGDIGIRMACGDGHSEGDGVRSRSRDRLRQVESC
jgi:hypothetical protein